ncbi:polysaccharide deacetylase family protein [Lyngbya aestuarii BL J]|uniref:Polysaccharide deacetylase family protein n=2 Tax=Lyngbya aestuarii TaxID=118322 RepID=U7QI62_9CYAN|nr:polysaccharide deacetylase family protein [Lyngbya aestuarii BL J]
MFSLTQPLASFVAQAFPDALFYQPTVKPVIALTIDDVGDTSTQLILDAIGQHNQKVTTVEQQAKATFFLTTSYLMEKKDAIINILDQQHEIGNHGVFDRTHADLEPEEFEEELLKAHQELTEETEAKIKWFRPGRGRYNPTMLQSLLKLSETEEYNRQFALASMIPLDTYMLTENPLFTVSYVSQFVFPGAILVLHGGSMRRSKNTVLALEKLLLELTQKNYRIVSLTELVEQH